MLVRVTGGKGGIVEYLTDGIKSGREFSRDELDMRICLDGNLKITDEIINSMDSTENYLHITLSFKESNLSSEKIKAVYEDYKDKIFSAYDKNEFNIYAEIHRPKIKSYEDKKTGETVERLPHVHIVIPKKNLVTGKVFNPFGKFTDVVKYDHAIQESINYKFKLSSPYDSQRPIHFDGNAKFLSRYKGDTFNGANAKAKSDILDLVLDKGIKSESELVNALSKKGDVTFGKQGKQDSYIKFKPNGASRNIRLTEACFKPPFLENRILSREKPTEKAVNKLVDEWVNVVSHEKKFIHAASPKTRKEYYSLKNEDREEYLNGRRTEFREQYFSEGGREASVELSIKRNAHKQPRGFAAIPNGLPSVSKRGLDGNSRKRPESTKSVLSGDENNHLVASRTSRDSELRWSTVGGRTRGRITSFDGFKVKVNIKPEPSLSVQEDKPLTYTQGLLKEHKDKVKQERELQFYRVLRRELKGDNLLNDLSKSHGLIKDDYQVFTAKDGSQRIRTGTVGYNVSDFCTKHMNMSWDETKGILADSYRKQVQTKKEQTQINSITFASNYTTQGYKSTSKLNRLNESVMILKRLQRLEKQGANQMLNSKLSELSDKFKSPFSEQNKISTSDETSLVKNMEQIKKYKQSSENGEFKYSDIVARKDLNNGKVDFHDFNTGKVAFTDTGSSISFKDKLPEPQHLAAAMAIASEKFGVLKITGSKEFKQSVIDVAVAKDLKVVFDDKKMQADFIAAREAFKDLESKATNDNSIENSDKFIVKYTVDDATKMVNVEINGKSPSAIDPDIMAKIKDADPFMKKFDDEAINSGKLDPTKAPESIPQDREFDKQGDYIGLKDTQLEAKTNTPDPVTLVEHGAAQYQFKDGESESYFVTLSNGQTMWGKGLESAINKSGAERGDEVAVLKKGSQPVQVDSPVKNDKGEVVGTQKIDAERNHWQVDVISKNTENKNEQSNASTEARAGTEIQNTYKQDSVQGKSNEKETAKDSDLNKVTYKYNQETSKIDISVNGKHPSTVNPELMATIRKNDPFLKSFTNEEVKAGSVEQDKSPEQPRQRDYDNDGQLVKAQEEQRSSTMSR